MRKNVLTFIKKRNDSTTMDRTKMAKWLYYYGIGGVLGCVRHHGIWALNLELKLPVPIPLLGITKYMDLKLNSNSTLPVLQFQFHINYLIDVYRSSSLSNCCIKDKSITKYQSDHCPENQGDQTMASYRWNILLSCCVIYTAIQV